MKPIIEALRNGFLFLDGANGTQLHLHDLPKSIHPEQYNLTHPETIVAVHKGYLNAGANAVSAFTFGAYSHKMDNVAEVIAAAMANARKAITDSGRTDCFIGMDLGPTGKLLEPVGDTPFDVVYNIFKETAMLGAKNGADFVLLETMLDSYECKAAILAVKENTDLPVFCSMTYEKNGRTLTGGTPLSSIVLLEALGADAIGVNCGAGPDFAAKIAAELVKHASVPVLVQPNAGLPIMVEGKEHPVFDLSPADYARDMTVIAQSGARLLGGCCGTTPAHIRALAAACAGLTPPPLVKKDAIRISTGGECLLWDDAASAERGAISAENDNVLTALQENDMFEIADLAIECKGDEVELLSVRLGADGVDEAAVMKNVINAIQQVAAIPMQIETDNLAALEIALRTINGVAAVKLLSGDAALAEGAKTLLARYGGVLAE